MKNKVDKRIIKTKQRLIYGFSELLKSKNFNLIKVSELTRVSSVNRATFYLHYDDINDFLHQIEDELISQLTNVFEENLINTDANGAIPVICAVFEFISSNKSLLSAILGENGDRNFRYRLSLIAREKIVDKFTDSGNRNPIDIYSIYYVINGCIGVIFKWFHSGMKESPEDMSLIIQQLIYQGVDLKQQ